MVRRKWIEMDGNRFKCWEKAYDLEERSGQTQVEVAEAERHFRRM
jgi:hypothetical protein